MSSGVPFNVGMDGSYQKTHMLQIENEIFHGLCGAVFHDEIIFFTSDAPPGFGRHSNDRSIRMEGVWKVDGGVGQRGIFRKLFELEYWYGFGTCTNYCDQARMKSFQNNKGHARTSKYFCRSLLYDKFETRKDAKQF